MKNFKALLTAIFAVCLMAGSALAYDFSDLEIEYWSGTGSNEAVMVVDYNASGIGGAVGADIASYAFGFRFDGTTTTGFDMVEAVGDEWDGSSAHSTTLEYSTTVYSWGTSLDDFFYDGNAGVSGTYWQYFVAETTSGNFDGYTSSGTGAVDRTLSDGSWDGWQNPGWEGGVPNNPVPVPAAVWLIGSAFLCILGIRRKNG